MKKERVHKFFQFSYTCTLCCVSKTASSQSSVAEGKYPPKKCSFKLLHRPPFVLYLTSAFKLKRLPNYFDTSDRYTLQLVCTLLFSAKELASSAATAYPTNSVLEESRDATKQYSGLRVSRPPIRLRARRVTGKHQSTTLLYHSSSDRTTRNSEVKSRLHEGIK